MELWPKPRQPEPRTALPFGYPPEALQDPSGFSNVRFMDGSALIMNVDSYGRLRIIHGRLRINYESCPLYAPVTRYRMPLGRGEAERKAEGLGSAPE